METQQHTNAETSGEPPVFREYQVIPKSRFLNTLGLHYTEEDWVELCRYSLLLGDWAEKTGIEEKPGPEGDNLWFGGFVGTYHLNSGKDFKIELNPEKLQEEEYRAMVEEIVEWCQLLGSDFYSRLVFSDPLHRFENILSYSNHLIELTELAVSTYLSPIVDQVPVVSSVVQGRINLPQTVRHLTQGQTLVVSSKTFLSVETLPVLLLIRFNYELSRAIQLYLDELKHIEGLGRFDAQTSFEKTLSRNLSYHQSFLLNPRHYRLIQASIEADFHDPDVLGETLEQSNGNQVYRDLVLLWEGYSSGRSLEASLEDYFLGSYTFKPVSKLYELWVLKKIYEILAEALGDPQISVESDGVVLSFEDGCVELLYNRPMGGLSKFDGKLCEVRPDFVLTCSDGGQRVVLVLDAKYKSGVASSDVQQLLAYLLMMGWSSVEDRVIGALCYIGTREGVDPWMVYSRESPFAQIHKVCIRPRVEKGVNVLKNMLTSATS